MIILRPKSRSTVLIFIATTQAAAVEPHDGRRSQSSLSRSQRSSIVGKGLRTMRPRLQQNRPRLCRGGSSSWPAPTPSSDSKLVRCCRQQHCALSSVDESVGRTQLKSALHHPCSGACYRTRHREREAEGSEGGDPRTEPDGAQPEDG